MGPDFSFLLSSFALRLSFSFFVLYAVNVIGLSKTQWGLIGSIISIVSMSLSLPGGMITDKIGRKPNILIARILTPISTLGLSFARGFNQTLLVRLVSSIGGVLAEGFLEHLVVLLGRLYWLILFHLISVDGFTG